VLVNKYKSNEWVIKPGSNSPKYQKEATGNKKKGRNQQQVQGRKILLKKGTPPISQRLSLGVGSPSGTTRGRALKHNSASFSSVLSISGFARDFLRSNSAIWKPQLRRGAHHNWAGESGYSPEFVFYTE
jgi:hypothetical protein